VLDFSVCLVVNLGERPNISKRIWDSHSPLFCRRFCPSYLLKSNTIFSGVNEKSKISTQW
jgi:hypothetical protein